MSDVTGLVIVDHGSRRAESNALLEAFAAEFATRGDYDVVEAAHMELAEPTIGEAFDRCVERGATRVVVCPFFLLPGRHWRHDIPELTEAAAARHPGISWLVTAPIGLHPTMGDVLAATLDTCLAATEGDGPRCRACGADDAAACRWRTD